MAAHLPKQESRGIPVPNRSKDKQEAEPPPEGDRAASRLYDQNTAYPIPSISDKMTSSWNTCGPDTAHLTFKEGGGRSPAELACLLQEFQLSRELPTAAVVRDRGVQGFANAAVDKAAGLRLDWTGANEEGNNPGFFCLQVKGDWFAAADGETAADFLQLLQAYGPYRITRFDLQQTTRTTRRLTPWWIKEFEEGRLRVVGKKHYEPRGKKDSSNGYPCGATLYHGSRSSERFARQYDKHLQADFGPPRRRDEIELKGQSARDLWADLHEELLTTEQLGTSRGATLHSFSKGAIRAFLPIRDTSPWAGKQLPKRWTAMAKEPTTWATLFDDDPITVKPRERKVSALLKSYRYAQSNFGAALSVQTARNLHRFTQDDPENPDAALNAHIKLLDDAVMAANEERAMEFIAELPLNEQAPVREIWFNMLRTAASNEERERD